MGRVNAASTQRYAVRISCKACHAVRTVASGPLHALFRARRWRDDLISASNRMRCSQCRQRWCSVDAVDAPPDSPAIGPTTDQAYQALPRRMRD